MKKKKYERPVIQKIENNYYVKHGVSARGYQKKRESIDNVKIADIVKKFGSPVFVFSEKAIREKFKKAQAAFKSRYPNFQFGWSYKTNYLKGICSIFHQEGAIAEVVSDFEYDKARALGIKGENIIYNGPYKSMESLTLAASENAKIHIDNFDEINDLEKVASKLDKKIPVTIRINMNTGIYPQWSRFGFNLESGQAINAVKRIIAGQKLLLNGLHTHIGTFILDPKAYGVAASKMLGFMDEIENEFGLDIEYIDLGGGFASLSHLKGVYQPPEIAVPSIEEYADEITRPFINNKKRPRLILETGRHLIDEAGYLISTIVGQKLLCDGRRSYIVDAGVNFLYTATWYTYNLELEKDTDGITEPSLINGPLCMNIDVINESIMLPRLERGDRIVFSPVGAYNVTQWMQFIRYRPKIALIGINGEMELLREKEKLADVESCERLPQRLKFSDES
ncbi:MAG: alanine racemase [Bacteriovoracaceae bacterium]|nr:alanine racemase [Bacteriovoracaceae bacterium]